MHNPVETSELLAFAKIVDSKSLSRAAADLRVPRATIGRRLARLEERLGVRLLRRTTRTLALTDAGESFYRHARIVLDAIRDAEASVRRSDDAVRGDLRVSVPPMIDPTFFEMICAFAKRFPAVRMHMHFSSTHVDLRRDGYDVAIRATRDLEPGLVARTLARTPIVAVASPAYVLAHGAPKSRRELRAHRLLMGFAKGEVAQTSWPIGRGSIHAEGVFFSNEITLLADAAVRGLGIACLPLLVVRKHLESGALLHILGGALDSESRIAVVHAEREFVPPQVRAFVEAVAAWAESALDKTLPEQCAKHAKPRAPIVEPAKKKRTRR